MVIGKKDQCHQYDVLTRILFIFAKLNNNFYAQGMNEIAGLMYSLMYSSPS